MITLKTVHMPTFSHILTFLEMKACQKLSFAEIPIKIGILFNVYFDG